MSGSTYGRFQQAGHSTTALPGATEGDGGPVVEVDDRKPGTGRGGFATTQWTLVLAAGDLEHPRSREALSVLCERYWHPLYVFARRRGHGQAAAQDLTQGFFSKLLEKNYLQAADRERGRFRSFLLSAFKHYIANEWHREQAQKRGGGRVVVSLDVDDAEGSYRLDPGHDTTPEELFDRRWALTQLERVVERLRSEMAEAGKRERFEHLKPFLTGEGGPSDGYHRVAEDLGLTVGAVKVAVHRLRRRFGELLRDEVAQTLDDPGDVDDEIRHLFAAIGRR